MDAKPKVISIISDLSGVKKANISLTTHLMDDLGFDCLDLIYLQMELEDKFNINIPDAKADNSKTVGEIISNIQEILKQGNEEK